MFSPEFLTRTCLTQVLCDVDALSVGESSNYRRPGCWGNGGVDGIDVIAEVNRFLPSVQGHKASLTFAQTITP